MIIILKQVRLTNYYMDLWKGLSNVTLNGNGMAVNTKQQYKAAFEVTLLKVEILTPGLYTNI